MDALLLIGMFYCHIIDDYYLQGILASMKQKKWWEKNAPDKFYQDDYKIVLVEHAFSWAVSISLPLIAYAFYAKLNIDLVATFLFIAIFTNTLIHTIVDDAKANLHKLNLTQDQIIHICQILITMALFKKTFM